MTNIANLLIVDDIPANLIYLEAVIRDPGINLIRALSGYEALEKTAGIELVLAIIDVRMPEMDGIELATKINKQSKQKVPVIFLTARYFIEEEILSAYDSGAVDFISKPISKHVLKCKINVFLDLFNQKQKAIQDAEILKEKTNELLKSNLAHQKSERRLSDITFSMAEWVWEVNKEGIYTHSSTRGTDLLGVSMDGIIGKTPFDFIVPEEIEKASAYFSEIMKNGAVIKDFENWNIKGNGERICLLTNGVPFFDEEGNLEGYRGVDKDITERKLSETILKESEIKYRSYIDNAPDGVFVSDETGRYLDVNLSASRITGYSTEELLTMSISDILPKEDLELGLLSFKKVVEDGFATDEIPYKHKNGSKKWWALSAVKLSDTRFLGFTKDITLRKNLQELLSKTSDRLSLAVQAGGIGVWDLDLASNELLWDERMYVLYGRIKGISKLSYNSWQSAIHPDDQMQTIIEFQLALEGKKEFDTEFRISWEDGSVHYIRANALVIRDEEGKPIQILGTNWEITEQKRLEEKLKSSETNFRTFFETLDDFVIVGNMQGEIIHTNDVVSHKLGYSIPELLGMDVLDLNPAEDRDEAEQIFADMLTGKRNNCPLPLKKKDGKKIPVETRIWFGKWNGDDCIFRLCKDMTAEQLAQKELHQANNFLDSIIENIPNMIFIKDAKNLNFVRFNKAGENLTGIAKDEIIGKNDLDFFPKEQAEGFIEHDQLTLKNKLMIDISKETIQTRYQGVRILHTQKVPILDDLGNPEYLLGISEDISERILAEQNLKLSEEKYRTMLNASPDGIFLIDLNGIITDVSDIGIEIFGFDSKTELIGKIFSEFINTEDKNTYLGIIERTLNEGIAQNIEVGIRKRNQTLFQSEVSSTFIQGVDGKHFSFMMTIRDISQRKKTEAKQIHADRMANLGEMATGMAHEINQPLNIISMVLDKILFETEKTDSINVEFLKNKSDKIFKNISRIRNIIDHVRSFSRSQDTYLSIAFDINTSIENALTMISEQFKHFGIDLRFQLQSNIPQILGNTYNFEQVIINLLNNAKDAVLERKSRQKEYEEMIIDIKTFESNQSLVVEIIDNGIGIEKTDFTNIMLPFYTTKEEGKGTGLGLSICYQIIKKMGGTIDITSDRYQGTKVILMLDIRKSH